MLQVMKRWLALGLVLGLLLTALPGAAWAADEAAETIDLVTREQSVAPTDLDTGDSETLFSGYVEKQLYPGGASGGRRMAARSAGSRLSGLDAALYARLSECIAQVAAGTRASTVFEFPVEELGLEQTSWNAEELGVDAIVVDGQFTESALAAATEKAAFDLHLILQTLLADNPYALYWYDKTVSTRASGVSISSSYDRQRAEYRIGLVGSITFYFPVAQEYSAGSYTVDTGLGQSVQTAVARAQRIVAQYAAASDYEKLVGYRREICDLVAYNHAAANGSQDYGNPWQLIWVFDGDASTSVVCEGYAKAFQYLCDLTRFDGGISCCTVTGTMNAGTGAGNHMWNIVTMEDGQNYLVDVTNCDAGTIGADDQLFLAGYAAGDVNSGYRF
ncbi:MAG: hypothetical protein IJ751_08675, partial [Oscillospiraceae bacterium]|nr:hypothetical protein [Oscillospiraceae bacterium]